MWKLGTRRPQPSAEKSPTGPLQVSIAKLEWPPCVKSGNCQSLEGFTWFPWISCNSGFLKISLGKLVPLWLDRYGPRNQKTRAILHFMFSYIFVSSVTLITCHFKMSMRWKVTCFIMCIVLWTCIVLVWWWVFGDRNILQLFTEYLWSLFGPNSFESSRLASFVSWLVVTPGSISSCDTSKCAETCWNGNWFYNDSNINCLWRQCKEWRSWGSRINAFHIFLWGCDTWVGWWPFTQVLLYHNHMIWIILVIFFAQTQTMSFRRRLCCY